MTQLQAYVLSLVIEIPVVIYFYYIYFKQKAHSLLGLTVIAVIATTFTHPLIWYLFEDLKRLIGYWITVVVLETGVVLIEALIYQYLLNLKINKAFVISFVSNFLSWLIGMLISIMPLLSV